MDPAQRDELLQLADQLAGLEARRRANVRRLYELLEHEGKLWASVALAIANKKDATGKPRYSNDVKRRAAARLALEDNAEYRRLRDEHESVRQVMDQIFAENMRVMFRRAVLAVAAGMAPEPSEPPAPAERPQDPTLEHTLDDFQEQLDRVEHLVMDIAVALRVREAEPEVDIMAKLHARVEVDKDERAVEPKYDHPLGEFGSKLRHPEIS